MNAINSPAAKRQRMTRCEMKKRTPRRLARSSLSMMGLKARSSRPATRACSGSRTGAGVPFT
jgi:hypothetical protein